jgi:dTMP kinase
MSLIVFEGLDGVGKSTIINKCKSILKNCIVTNDPKGTPKSRQLFIDNIGKCSDELDLFIKCRKMVVDEVINPALSRGLLVLCDRYIESTYAYQGALNISEEQIYKLNCNFPTPNLTFLIICQDSIRKNRLNNVKLDVIESRGEEYFKKVDEIYRKRAYENNYNIIDNSKECIHDTSLEIVKRILNR